MTSFPRDFRLRASIQVLNSARGGIRFKNRLGSAPFAQHAKKTKNYGNAEKDEERFESELQ